MSQLELFADRENVSRATAVLAAVGGPARPQPAGPLQAATIDEALLRGLRAWLYDHPGYDADAIAGFTHRRTVTIRAALVALEARGLAVCQRERHSRYGGSWYCATEVFDLSAWRAA